MAREEEEEDARPLTTVRVRARPDPFLVVCRCFSVFTIAAALICVAVNGVSAYRSFENASDIFGGIFRCYAILIAILVAVAETEWGFIFKFWRVGFVLVQSILEYWAGRGMLQIFVAVMTKAYSESTGEKQVLVILQEIGSYMLLACGVIYVLSGILCIGCVKRSRLQKELTREQAAKHLEVIHPLPILLNVQ
ncbi:hypothetical protein EJ110_NYTH45257 [Nymphaea thermarum]|nr:hypothetical protein EJ110_NYTH45257 [Nymphaea thermarum]